MPMPAPVSRRTAVAGLAALTGALAGCTSSSLELGPPAASSPTGTPTGRPATTRSPRGGATRDLDVELASRVLAGEQAMLARVLATLRRHPDLAGALTGTRQAHRAHVDLLTGAVPPEARTPGAAARLRPVPDRSAAALSLLAGAEDRLAIVRSGHALDARSGPFARALASMAASAAQQGALLAQAAADRR